MRNKKLRLGIIGANVGYGWTPRAHAPAIAELPEIELVAVCTAHEDTAKEAANAFGAELAFHNHLDMLDQAELDAVAVVVRVPKHYQLSCDVIRAGKHIYTEWPLGANLAEARDISNLADESGVSTMVGLQSRASPVFMAARDMIQNGFVGTPLSANLNQFNPGVLSRPTGRTWQKDVELGATTLSIMFGHSIDALCMCLGEFERVGAKVSTRVPQWKDIDTGKYVDVTSPDTIFIHGALENGIVVSAQVSNIPYHGSGYRFDIYGTDGTLSIQSKESPSTGFARLYGGRADDEELKEIDIKSSYVTVTSGVPDGPAFNIAQLWDRFSNRIFSGEEMEPDFGLAVKRHELLDAIQNASETGNDQFL